MNIPNHIWNDFFDKKGLSPDLKKAYLRYIYKLNYKGLPIVFELKHLAKILGIKYKVLVYMVYNSESYYYSFQLKKRRGGLRDISAPYPLMRYTQFWILNKILPKVSLHDSSFAYQKERSIVDNAKKHLGQNHLLKMDLKNFFPSIKIKRIIPIFKYLGYSNHVSFYLASLCCLDDSLPQGACTSPYLSNIVCKRLDKKLEKLATTNQLNYSRYADDLTFSGNIIPELIIDEVTNLVISEGFKVNEEKTILLEENKKKIVTGISVSGDELKLPKTTRKSLRQEVFYIKKYGLKNHLKKKEINDPIYLERLVGKFHFWLQIEPKNEFVLDATKYLKSLRPKTENI